MILLKYGKQERSQFSIKKYFIASWTNTGRCLKIKRTKSTRKHMPAELPEIHQKAFYFLFHIIQCSANPGFFSPLKWVHLLAKTMYSTHCRLSFAYSNNNYCCSWWNIPHQAEGCTPASSRRHITTSSFKTDAQHFITRRKCAAITPTSTRSTRKCPSRFKSSAEHIFDYGDARIGSQTAGVNARKRVKSGSLSLVNTSFLYYPRPAFSISRGIP